MSPRVEGVLPFWRDRPAAEALDVAAAVQRSGLQSLWIGELQSFDAFALATAVGGRAPGLPLTVGPLAVGVRSPAALALGLRSVATLTGSPVALALGASSPVIVTGWHDRDWAHAASRTRETIAALRPILAGGSAIYDDAPLQRRFRDAHTATAHFQVNAASRELPGRILLGQQADASML